ncbi:hypothetical protein [Acinetobacter junii]|uniref:hypothetical protein n=1 Tax=Acinetobacter junii TaxID=40215 RepID=UPI000F66119C|nr:hypothetical protein [Acinetobacter junii]RSE33401.1 hypothetical protein EGT62_09255 [Acinetobacter junii]
MIKKGDRVKVDFINNPETIHAGIRFSGYGVLDLVEDGRVYGRLDDGQTFMCLESDVAKERPISRRRKRKLSKEGMNVYWSKHLESYVYVMSR